VNESRHTGRGEGGGARHDMTRIQPQIYESKTSQIQRYPCLSYRALYLHKRALHLGKRALYPHTRGLYATHDSHATTDIRVHEFSPTTLSFFPFQSPWCVPKSLTFLQKSPLSQQHTLKHLQKEPDIPTKEPSISAKEASISAKEP
jgi:hypothetical protein